MANQQSKSMGMATRLSAMAETRSSARLTMRLDGWGEDGERFYVQEVAAVQQLHFSAAETTIQIADQRFNVGAIFGGQHQHCGQFIGKVTTLVMHKRFAFQGPIDLSHCFYSGHQSLHTSAALPIVQFNPGLIGPALDVANLLLVIQIPPHRFANTGFEGLLLQPIQLGAHLAGINRVTAVVARAI